MMIEGRKYLSYVIDSKKITLSKCGQNYLWPRTEPLITTLLIGYFWHEKSAIILSFHLGTDVDSHLRCLSIGTIRNFGHQRQQPAKSPSETQQRVFPYFIHNTLFAFFSPRQAVTFKRLFFHFTISSLSV